MALGVHSSHAAHSCVPHGHEGGKEFVQFCFKPLEIDADHIGNVMVHSVHRVVGLMTMQRPIARSIGDKLDVDSVANGNIDRGCEVLGGFWTPPSSIGGDSECIAVEVDWMAVHAEVAVADPHPLISADNKRTGTGIDFSVKGEIIEIEGNRIRSRCAGRNAPLLEKDRKVPVDRRIFRFFGMDDKKSHEAKPHLDHLVIMGMVHVGPMLAERELISEGLAARDRRLVEA